MSREQMVARQKELLALAKSQNRAMTEDELKEFDSLQRSIDAIDAAAASTGHANQRSAKEDDGDGEDDDESKEDGQKSLKDAQKRAAKEERDRIRSIEEMCRHFGVDSKEYIDNGTSVDSTRAAIVEKLMTDGAPINGSIRAIEDEGDKFRRAVTDGLLMRSGVRVENPADGADQFRAMSLRDLAVECLSREGRSTSELLRMDKSDLYNELCRQFYNPSAAFPAIMDATIKKSIVDLYNKVPTTFQEFTTKGTLSDFKETADHEYVIGGVGDFLEVPENGEIHPDMPQTELLPSRKLKTYGKQFSMTRQAFINDDIGFLTKVPGLYATAAKKTIDKQVYGILYNNPAIFDGVALFHADHKNLTVLFQNSAFMVEKPRLLEPKKTLPMINGFKIKAFLCAACFSVTPSSQVHLRFF